MEHKGIGKQIPRYVKQVIHSPDGFERLVRSRSGGDGAQWLSLPNSLAPSLFR
jgi:hypothetical protein